MDFYQIITLLFSFLGLMNGLFAAGLFRLKRFYLYGIAGALISCGAVQYKDPDYIENELRKTSVKILDNSHVALQKDGALLYVAGVDYPEMRGEGRAELMAQMVRDAFDGIPEDSAKIFLAHHSDFIDAGFENRAFLTLTGHTHGTQFGIFGKPMITPFKYTRGMYSDGKHCGYVSRGSGGWFPFRFDTSRELTIFTLKKK